MGTVKRLATSSPLQVRARADLLAAMETKLDCLTRKVDRLLAGQERVLGTECPGELAAVLRALATHCEQQSRRLGALERLAQGTHTTLELLVERLGHHGVGKPSPAGRRESSAIDHPGDVNDKESGVKLDLRREQSSGDRDCAHGRVSPGLTEGKTRSPSPGTVDPEVRVSGCDGTPQMEPKLKLLADPGCPQPLAAAGRAGSLDKADPDSQEGERSALGPRESTNGTGAAGAEGPQAAEPPGSGQGAEVKGRGAPGASLAADLQAALLGAVLSHTPPLRHVHSCPEALGSCQREVKGTKEGDGRGGRVDTAEDTERSRQPAALQDPGHTLTLSGWTGVDSTGGREAAGPSLELATPAPSFIEIRVSPAERSTDTACQRSPDSCFRVIDDSAPQPAPFPHRLVSLQPAPSFPLFDINTKEVLGGGRFGRVHTCTEKATGLKLAAKIIKARSAKEKESAHNEIQVMNQLSHVNLIQLYSAFEARTEVVLIMEYVEGGELFERIVDDSCRLTEVDTMLFVKQICEGIHYMHQMYVLHLDLKPENILCVNKTGHQVKIIDFGLARRFRPREKLRVSFGTPEFLAPEIVNFDFVSFPTDMWTLGVISYMLLSGLSPFLGDDDSQTLNNVLAANWYFDEEAFEHVSHEAKDFISSLLIREKSGRLSAAQCLKHPWLDNIAEKAKHSHICLHSQVLLKKYMARRMWKKNYIAVAAANRFKKIGSSGSLTTMGI
ncbi:myosin light chain kinase 2, skeletal/cardiac muscle [Lepisosteus oculatus]|uniref:myosin light chain kinase 2, skeletal/cardiac muscle n=1 Tax=Lepisosteus oculatus TaxID=7918 RepID=UPI0035F52A06